MQRYWIKHIYDSYLEECVNDGVQYVSLKTFQSLWMDYAKYIINKVLYEGLTFTFPYQLGDLYIEKYIINTKVRAVDYGATRKLGKTVYYTNEHSNGYKYRVKWEKKGIHITNGEKYRFRLVRGNNRLLAALIKSGEYDYIERND
jgi:hypothetical protein